MLFLQENLCKVSLPKTIRANCGRKGQAENRSLGSKQEFVFVISVWEFYTDTISTAFAVLTDFVIECKKAFSSIPCSR